MVRVRLVRALGEAAGGRRHRHGRADALRLRTPVPLRGEDRRTVADFAVSEGQGVGFDLSWYRSHEAAPPALDVEATVEATAKWWGDWSSRCTYEGE